MPSTYPSIPASKKIPFMQKAAVNCAGRIACFKKAVGYVGGTVTTSSVTVSEQPSAEEPDTVRCTIKGRQGSLGILWPNPGRANPNIKSWSSRLGVGQRHNNSTPQNNFFFFFHWLYNL